MNLAWRSTVRCPFVRRAQAGACRCDTAGFDALEGVEKDAVYSDNETGAHEWIELFWRKNTLGQPC